MTLPKPTRNISVNVTDGQNGVNGASVIIENTIKTTGSAGGCTFADISDGEHTVTVTADGYVDYSGEITVGEDSTSFSITMTAS